MNCAKFVDHIVFRVTQLDRTERFYSAFLGEPSERAKGSVMYKAGKTRLFFTQGEAGSRETYEKE